MSFHLDEELKLYLKQFMHNREAYWPGHADPEIYGGKNKIW